MRIPIYQVDAFADEVFRGNPAAVCPLDRWLPDATLQAIAMENNLSETAFLLPGEDPMPLRWFTPREEVPLCGHATLASGFIALTELAPERDEVAFATKSGVLTVTRRGGGYAMDLPARALDAVPDVPRPLREGLGAEAVEVFSNTIDANYYVIVESEAVLAALAPDFRLLEQLRYGVAVSAHGDSADFVSRYFAPHYGIPEDPVTGSIHCALGPLWAERLGTRSLNAAQLSARGGRLGVEVNGDRVVISGGAVAYLRGEISVP